MRRKSLSHRRAANDAAPRSPLRLVPTGRAAAYPLLVIAGLLFAQSLKLPVSYMVFVFILLWPVALAVQFIAAALFLRVSIDVPEPTATKHEPIAFCVLISNSCPIPFPFVEAEVLTPDARGAKCVPVLLGSSIMPLAACQLSGSANFGFRGAYTIGLCRLYVYDCFRMLRFTLNLSALSEVYILPRRTSIPEKYTDSSSDPDMSQNVLRRHGSDNTEPSDIRSYLRGDSLKSIHWKLSAKSEELIVKDYSRSTGRDILIVADLEGHYQHNPAAEVRTPAPEYTEVIDQLNSDLVVESCLAAAERELRYGNRVTLCWLSETPVGPKPNLLPVDLAGFDAAFRMFGTAPLAPYEKQAELLAPMLASEDGAVIYVTASLAPESIAAFISLSAANSSQSTRPELIYCADLNLYIDSPDEDASENERLSGISGSADITSVIANKEESA